VALPLAMLWLVGILAVYRGRLFCNTVCPVGTLLGLLSRRAAWRLTIDQTACVKCGECLKACKAQCIDLRAGTIDASRCVACYNCIGSCAELGIAHEFAWIPPPEAETEPIPQEDAGDEPEPEPAAPLTVEPADPSRRAFLTGATVAVVAAGVSPGRAAAVADAPADANASIAICPPGAGSIDRYLNRCTACHLCVSACPTHVLQPALLEYGFAGWLRPRLDYGRSFCNYDCRRCGEVCPTGAITRLDLADKQLTRIGRAVFKQELCVVDRDGTDCAACSEHCPTKAVDTVPFRDGLRLPVVHDELCIGCGACEFACPVVPEKAIKVTGRRRHERAEPAIEAGPAVIPVTDFPF
jgi:ferredoxin